MKKSVSGFTIVELLIVIVVIAILASITVVAYNGIQARAIFTQQVTEVDRVGKAIQLWSAENGKTLGESGAGYNSEGYGSLQQTGGSYSALSVENLLRDAGYLKGDISVNGGYLLSPCTGLSSPRWVVIATLNPAPPTNAADQIAESGCTNSLITLYTGSSYNRNFIKVY